MTTNGTVTDAPRRPRFADGSGVRLELSDGDWVLVRRELTYGQQRRLAASGLTGIDPAVTEGQRLQVDLAAYDLERLVTWLLDWSFTDADGEHVVLGREAIENLHPDAARELNEALDRHIEAQEGKGAPAPTGPSAPAATSSSVKRSAGPGRP